MADVKLYTATYCGYSKRALQLLDTKKVAYKNIDVTDNQALRQEMQLVSGGRTTVPQIFINGKHIGGCDELYGLEASGQLDKLLQQS